MLKVIPLRYGTIFKKAFGDPEVFSRFAGDVLGMDLHFTKVLHEFSYPKPIGHVKIEYDLYAEDTERRVIVEILHVREQDFFDRFLHYHMVSLVEQAESHEKYRILRNVFTLVLLTTAPKEKDLRFSVAVSDMDPMSEQGARLGVYRHRLVFLNPRIINEQTPAGARGWMELIADSLDGEVDEEAYPDPMMQRALRSSVLARVSPEELAHIKDEAAWEDTKMGAREEGRKAGLVEGELKGHLSGLTEGELKGRRDALLRLLARAGLSLTDEERAHVEACQDLATLDRWLENVLGAKTAADVLS